MGIVDLKENKQEGRYAVEVVRDLERAKQFKTKMTDAIDKLKVDIEEKTKDIAPAEEKVISAANEYNAEILVLQDRAVILEQLKDDLEVKQNTVIGIQAQLSIKQQEKQSIEDALTNPGLTPEQIADLQAQLAIVNDQIDDLTDQLNALNADIADTVARIEELEDPKKQLKKVNELTEKFLEIAAERDKIKYEILFLELSKTAKEKRLNEYDTVLNDVDARDVWCVDYETTLEPVQDAENHLVSIEINDDPTLILLAPRTYAPTPDDVEAIIAVAEEKQVEYEDLDEKFNANESALEVAKNKVDEKRQEIFDERAFITTIPIETSKPERERLILESNARLKNLETELLRLAGAAIALADKSRSYEAKKSLVAQVIARLNNESTKMVAALNSPSGILVPVIDEFTKQIQPTHSSGPSAVFYNKSLLPGYQKWLPTFRMGTIKTIQGDICDVELDDATSSQQSLNINQQASLTNVPIKYGNCNGAVFVVGDNVVVEFKGRDQTKPAVIGFQDHPRPCGGIVCIPSSDSAPGGWGYPLRNQAGDLINPPLGTVGGTRPQYVLLFSAPPNSLPRVSRNIEPALGGNCHSNGSQLVSWHGPFGFNIAPEIKFFFGVDSTDLPGYETQLIDFGIVGSFNVTVAVYSRFSTAIYQNKKLRKTAPGDVLGAGFYGNTLICVVSVNSLQDAIYALNNSDEWYLVGNINFPNGLYGTILPRYHSYWFSADGDKITSLVTSLHVVANKFHEYANIPEVTLNKDEMGVVHLVSVVTNSYYNYFEISDTKVYEIIGDNELPYPINTSETASAQIIVSGNDESILGVGFYKNELKKIIAKVSYSVSGAGSKTVNQTSETLIKTHGTSTGVESIISSYYINNILLIEGSLQVTSNIDVGVDYIDFTSYLNSITSNTNNTFVYLLYYNISTDFYLYIKETTEVNESQANNSSTDLWNENATITRLKDIYSSNNLLPINIASESNTISRTFNADPLLSVPSILNENSVTVSQSKLKDYFGKPDDPFTGAVDQYGNGVFQYRSLAFSFQLEDVDKTILPKTYSVNSLTDAVGANQRLANMESIFQDDIVVTEGIIFRV